MKAIIKRELNSYFRGGIGYVFCAVYLFFSALNFGVVLLSGRSSLFPQVYHGMFYIILMIIPVLTMRLFSEERRQRTDQVLLTSPIGVWPMVLGKFFSALAVYAGCIGFTLVYAVVFSWYGHPSWALVFGNIIGAVLLGAAFIAIGMFISSLTESQVIAAIGSLFVATIFMLLDAIPLDTANQTVIAIINWITFMSHYKPFTQGILDFSSVVFFATVSLTFIFFTVRAIERRRWS